MTHTPPDRWPPASDGSVDDAVPRASPLTRDPRLPVEVTASVLKGRFTVLILWNLFWGGKGFYQLLRDVEGITRRSLTLELDEMERANLVRRRVRSPGSSKPLYVLTPLGESLKVVLAAMHEWGLMVTDTGASLAVQRPSGFPQLLYFQARDRWKVHGPEPQMRITCTSESKAK